MGSHPPIKKPKNSWKISANFGYTLNKGNIDFIYAQTCDAFGKVKKNTKTGKIEIIGSINEDFKNTNEDIEAYINFAENMDIKIYI